MKREVNPKAFGFVLKMLCWSESSAHSRMFVLAFSLNAYIVFILTMFFLFKITTTIQSWLSVAPLDRDRSLCEANHRRRYRI